MGKSKKKVMAKKKKTPVELRENLNFKLNPKEAAQAASSPLQDSRKTLFDDPLKRANEYSNIRALIEGQAKKYGDKTYLIYEDTGQHYSYRDLDRESSRSLNVIRELGANKGARIGILDANTPDFVFLYMGGMKGAYTCAPLNYHLKGPELLFCLENSNSELLFVAREYWSEINKILPQLGFLKAIVLMGKGKNPSYQVYTNLKELKKAQAKHRSEEIPLLADFESLRKDISTKIPSSHPKPRKQSAGEIIYTSGTTGKPKGVILRHHQFLTDAKYIAGWFHMSPGQGNKVKESSKDQPLPGETRMMMVLPLFHVNAEVVTTFTPLVCGGSLVMFKKFSASRFWPAVERYGVQIVSVVPTILTILISQEHQALGSQAYERAQALHAPMPKPLKSFAAKKATKQAQKAKQKSWRKQGLGAAYDLSSLRTFICGAAPLPAEVQLEFERTFLIPVTEGYGLSETTCYSSFNPTEGWRKIATIGVEVGNQVGIFNAKGKLQPAGSMGEICIRGENVMKEYFKRPEANVEAFRGGWFHSGDVGEIDASGFIRIRDRVKDMIIRGGENIYPREIDEVLYTHEAVENAATIGVPDEKYGEEVLSFVVLSSGKVPQAGAAKKREAEILNYCRERLADYKVPREIRFVKSIPTGPTGKLLRRALREQR